MAKKERTKKQIIKKFPKLDKKNIASAKKIGIVILAGIAVFLVAKRFKSQFIVATVNRQVISRWSLNRSLIETYGTTTLDELVNKALLKDLAKENDVEVTEEDIQAEIDELVTSLGGEEAFDQALEQYQLSLDDLKDRITTSLIQEKLAEAVSQVEITDEQVRSYYDTNESLFTDQTFEETESSIRDMLYQQELQNTFNTWFQTERDQATVKLFI